MSWVWADGSAVNLDVASRIEVFEVNATTWVLRVGSTNLDGVYTTQSAASEALANLLNVTSVDELIT